MSLKEDEKCDITRYLGSIRQSDRTTISLNYKVRKTTVPLEDGMRGSDLILCQRTPLTILELVTYLNPGDYVVKTGVESGGG